MCTPRCAIVIERWTRPDATSAAERIGAAVGQPHLIEEEQIHIGYSIGIAMFPEDGASADTLLRHADTALHSAKAAGRNVWRFFHQELLTSAIQRRRMEDGMRSGLDKGEFELFYQPKVSLADGTLCGC